MIVTCVHRDPGFVNNVHQVVLEYTCHKRGQNFSRGNSSRNYVCSRRLILNLFILCSLPYAAGTNLLQNLTCMKSCTLMSPKLKLERRKSTPKLKRGNLILSTIRILGINQSTLGSGYRDHRKTLIFILQ